MWQFTRPHGKRRLHKEPPRSSSLSLLSTHAPAGTSTRSKVTKGKLFYHAHKLLKLSFAKRTFPWNHILPTNNSHIQKKSKNFRLIQSWKPNSFNLGNKDENVNCQQIVLQSNTTHTPPSHTPTWASLRHNPFREDTCLVSMHIGRVPAE